MTNKKEYAYRLAKGLCPRCGRTIPSDSKTKTCETCLVKVRKKVSKWKESRRSNGTCTGCTNKRQDGFTRCRSCIDRTREVSDARRKRLFESGLCFNCGKRPRMADPNKICRLCYFKRVAGHCLGLQSRYKELITIFQNQGGICPYTGDVLVIGDNASIDHIYPRCRFPDLKNDSSNLEWVTFAVNFAKRDLTKDEFLSLVRKINDSRI